MSFILPKLFFFFTYAVVSFLNSINVVSITQSILSSTEEAGSYPAELGNNSKLNTKLLLAELNFRNKTLVQTL